MPQELLRHIPPAEACSKVAKGMTKRVPTDPFTDTRPVCCRLNVTSHDGVGPVRKLGPTLEDWQKPNHLSFRTVSHLSNFEDEEPT